jgi:hypothetical protein
MRMARAVGAMSVGLVGALASAHDLRAAGAAQVQPSVVAWVDAFLGASVAPGVAG